MNTMHPKIHRVVVDECDFSKSPHANRFEGHFIRTDRKDGFTPEIADRVIEMLRGRKLDAPKRQFVAQRFAGAPGLVYVSVIPALSLSLLLLFVYFSAGPPSTSLYLYIPFV
jgi:hypothetical protein